MLQNYRTIFLRLAYRYAQNGEIEEARTVYAAMKSYLPEDVLPTPEHLKNGNKALERLFEDGK